jgi:hypothetical protein
MPGRPIKCRLQARRCARLAKSASSFEARQTCIALAETWRRLAAELESDQALLEVLSEVEFDSVTSEPTEALPVERAA